MTIEEAIEYQKSRLEPHPFGIWPFKRKMKQKYGSNWQEINAPLGTDPASVEALVGAGLPGAAGEIFRYLAPKFEEGEAERKERYKAGIGEMAEAAGLFGPGYGAGMEQTALTGAKQSLIGRGLGGTTRPMAVGAGLKAQFEDLRRGKLATALQQMAEYRRLFPAGTTTAGVLAGLATGGYGMLSAAQQAELGKQQQSSAGGTFLSSLAGAAGSALGGDLVGGIGNLVSGLFGGNSQVPMVDFSY